MPTHVFSLHNSALRVLVASQLQIIPYQVLIRADMSSLVHSCQSDSSCRALLRGGPCRRNLVMWFQETGFAVSFNYEQTRQYFFSAVQHSSSRTSRRKAGGATAGCKLIHPGTAAVLDTWYQVYIYIIPGCTVENYYALFSRCPFQEHSQSTTIARPACTCFLCGHRERKRSPLACFDSRRKREHESRLLIVYVE